MSQCLTIAVNRNFVVIIPRFRIPASGNGCWLCLNPSRSVGWDHPVGPPSNHRNSLLPSSDAPPQSKDYGRHLFMSGVPISQHSSFDIQSLLHHGKIIVSKSTKSPHPCLQNVQFSGHMIQLLWCLALSRRVATASALLAADIISESKTPTRPPF